MSHQTVIVLDFGGQYNQLIARRVRECQVYCEVKPCTTPLAECAPWTPSASSSPADPTACIWDSSPKVDPEIFTWGVPILGICYGCQLMAHLLGGQVTEAQDDSAREYGKTETYYDTACKLFRGLPDRGVSWMSHGDYMARVPEGFALTAPLRRLPQCCHRRRGPGLLRRPVPPGVNHTQNGVAMIRNFLYEVCHAKGDWTMGDYCKTAIAQVREKVGGGKVLLALSAGVDSSVVARPAGRGYRPPAHLRLCGPRPHAAARGDEVEGRLLQVGHQLRPVDAETRFLLKLAGVDEAGAQAEDHRRGVHPGLRGGGQEDRPGGLPGPGHHLPRRHRVGGGERRRHQEPPQRGRPARLRGLPGDHRAPAPAVQGRGAAAGPGAGLPEYLVSRQPFPGPGLAIRIIGDITKEKADTLRLADFIFREEIARAGWKRIPTSTSLFSPTPARWASWETGGPTTTPWPSGR